MESVKAAFSLCGILSGRATHSGRRCGAQQLQLMGLNADNLASRDNGLTVRCSHTGRRLRFQEHLQWLDSKIDPIVFCVIVYLHLSSSSDFFPWIEDQCSESDRAAWRKKCDKTMEDAPESNTSIIREIYDKIVEAEEEEKNEKEKLQQRGTNEATALCGQCSNKKGKKAQPQEPKRKIYTYFDVAIEGFLRFLLGFRRVIIQDAVLTIRDGATNHLTNDPIFQHDLFKQYSKNLLMAMDRIHNARLDQEKNLNLERISQTLEDLKVDRINSITALQQERRLGYQSLKASLCQTVQKEFKDLAKNLIEAFIPVVLETVQKEPQRHQQPRGDVDFVEYVRGAVQTAVDLYHKGVPGRIQENTRSDIGASASNSTVAIEPTRLLGLYAASRRHSPEALSRPTASTKPATLTSLASHSQQQQTEHVPSSTSENSEDLIPTIAKVWIEYKRYERFKSAAAELVGHGYGKESRTEERYINDRSMVIHQVD
ncbi:hypothetical protein BG004_001162 [Podila humilis]|nr:hypothetical protein BG004_001162 [Podila humilis]